MTVKEFIGKYHTAKKVPGGVETFLEQSLVTKYVPYLTKKVTCQKIVDATYYITEKNDEGVVISRTFRVDSGNTYLLFVTRLIATYYGIELSENIADDYDLLNKEGLIAPRDAESVTLMTNIPAAEYAEFKALLEMAKSDLIANEYEPGAYISNRINSLGIVLGSAIQPILDAAGITPEDIRTLLLNSRS